MALGWFLLIGAVLVVMAFASHLVERLPLSSAIIYLGAGVIAGPAVLGLIPIHPVEHAALLEALAEIAVLITLFAVGLQLRLPSTRTAWRVPVRLAGAGLVASALLAALAGWALLGLALPAALLLGAILAPTDPVLASEVQVRHPGDRDAVRSSLTAEGGINDGTAYPVVTLALGALGLHELGPWGWRWLALDLLWTLGGGLALGWLCGLACGRAVHALRAQGHAPVSEEFLLFGVIALTYGVARLLGTSGFLAVFAAGAGFYHAEQRLARMAPGRAQNAPDGTPDGAHSSRLLAFSEQCERLAEVGLVLVIGACLAWVQWSLELLAFAVAMVLLVRPLSVFAVVRRSMLSPVQRRLVAWFGIRGVGSVYYLAHVIGLGLPAGLALRLTDAALATIALSIIVHGVSVTPIMERYQRARRSGAAR